MSTVRKVRRGKTTSKKPRSSTLPTEASVVSDHLMDFCWMIFGRKAIGKTTLASLLAKSKDKKVLILQLEKGRRNLKGLWQLPKKGEPYPNWIKVQQYVEDFIKSTTFDVLVIDTLDRFYDLCFDHVCKQYGCKSPAGKGREGSGIWIEIAAEFNALLQMLSDSGKGIVFISHEKIRELEAKRMKALKDQAKNNDDSEEIKIERIEPSASPAACRAAEEMCDFVLYYGYENRKRVITVRDKGDYFWVACGVQDRFLDPDGEEINSFYAGETPLEAKSNLFKAFNNQLRDIDYKPPKRIKKKPKRRVRA